MRMTNYITAIRINLGLYFLGVVAFILSESSLFASDDRILLGVMDGIELHVKKPDAEIGIDPASSLTFTVTNTNDYELKYLDNNRGKMFSFTLLDNDGRLIKQIPEWYRRNDPYASDVGKRSHTPIPPGQHLEFTLCLRDAYGVRWTDGKILLVKWEPSDGNEGLIPIGWQVEAKCIPAELLKQFGTSGDSDPLNNGPSAIDIDGSNSGSIENDTPYVVKAEPMRLKQKTDSKIRTTTLFFPGFFLVSFLCIMLVIAFFYRRFVSERKRR